MKVDAYCVPAKGVHSTEWFAIIRQHVEFALIIRQN